MIAARSCHHSIALLALLLPALGCVPRATIPSPPPHSASVDQREQFYQDYKIANPGGERAMRCVGHVGGCICDHPCNPLPLHQWTELGNGTSVYGISPLEPLVENTPAEAALASYQIARTSQDWLEAFGGVFITFGLLMLYPPIFQLAVAAARPADTGTFFVATVGGSLLLGLLFEAGAAVAYVTGVVSRETFFELYNPALRQRLGLPAEEPAP